MPLPWPFIVATKVLGKLTVLGTTTGPAAGLIIAGGSTAFTVGYGAKKGYDYLKRKRNCAGCKFRTLCQEMGKKECLNELTKPFKH